MEAPATGSATPWTSCSPVGVQYGVWVRPPVPISREPPHASKVQSRGQRIGQRERQNPDMEHVLLRAFGCMTPSPLVVVFQCLCEREVYVWAGNLAVYGSWSGMMKMGAL